MHDAGCWADMIRISAIVNIGNGNSKVLVARKQSINHFIQAYTQTIRMRTNLAAVISLNQGCQYQCQTNPLTWLSDFQAAVQPLLFQNNTRCFPFLVKIGCFTPCSLPNKSPLGLPLSSCLRLDNHTPLDVEELACAGISRPHVTFAHLVWGFAQTLS